MQIMPLVRSRMIRSPATRDRKSTSILILDENARRMSSFAFGNARE
jgi:hypothetical protein